MTASHLHTGSRGWRLAIVFILVGFALRLFRLDAQALTGDEAFTIVNWTRLPLSTVFSTIALIDPQPPATMLTIIGWIRVVGDSVFAARMLSALAGTITLAAAYALGRKLGNHRVALFALAFATLSPVYVWYAQDVRGYALWIAVSAVSAWAFLQAVTQPARRGRWLVYIGLAALGLYTYYLEAFLIIAQNLYVLTCLPHNRRLLKPWITSQLAIAALVAPWYLQPSLRNSGYEPTAGDVNLPWVFEALLFGETLPARLNPELFAIGMQVFTAASIIGIILTIAAIITLARSRWHHAAVFLPLYALVPTLMLAVLTVVTGEGFFRPRYVAASAMAYILLAAYLIEILLQYARQRVTAAQVTYTSLAGLVALTLFGIGGVSLWAYRFGPSKAPPWPEIVDTLHAQADEDDIVIQNFPDPAFQYYYAGRAEATILPQDRTSTPAETYAALEQILAEYDHIWFLPVPTDLYDAEQIVAGWLLEHAQLTSEQWIGRSHLMQFARWEVDTGDIKHPLDAQFGDVATLRGVSFTPPVERWQRGTTIYVETIWEPTAQTEEALRLFVHLLGPIGPDGLPLWAQDDHAPQYERISSTTWTPGEMFRDVAQLTIPVDAPAGEYAITTGLYDPTMLERVPLDATAPSEPDSTTLAIFSLP